MEPPPNRFVELLEGTSLPARVDMVQCSRNWIEDTGWVDVRRRLDSKLLGALVEKPGLSAVRRLVLYDLRSFEGGSPRAHATLVSGHAAWVRSIVRDLHYLGAVTSEWTGQRDRWSVGSPEGEGLHAPSYELRQLVVGRAGEDDDVPADGIWVAHEATASSRFDGLWRTAIEHNPRPGERVSGPYGDRDPLLHLWEGSSGL